jgi:hypothetical protein
MNYDGQVITLANDDSVMATLRPDGNYNLVGETNTLWGCPETHVETLVNAEQRRESQRLQAGNLL